MQTRCRCTGALSSRPKMALTSVAVVPVSSLLLKNAAGAGHLRRTATDDPVAMGLSYLHDANKSTNSMRKPNQCC